MDRVDDGDDSEVKVEDVPTYFPSFCNFLFLSFF